MYMMFYEQAVCKRSMKIEKSLHEIAGQQTILYNDQTGDLFLLFKKTEKKTWNRYNE